jgi:Flp pilus assembly protein TadG
MSRLRTLRRDKAGLTAVEFAIILPGMLTLICGSLEMGHMIFARIVLDGAVVEAARVATASLETAETARTVVMRNSITQTMSAFPIADGRTITIETKVYQDFNSVRAEAYNDVDKNGKYDLGEPFTDRNKNDKWDASAPITGSSLGGAGQVVSYTASYPKKILFGFLAGPLGLGTELNLRATTVVRNESVVRRVT